MPPRSPRSRALRPLALGVGAALLLGSCSAEEPAPQPTPTALTPVTPDGGEQAGNPDFARFYDQRLSWTGCQGDFECARLTVPVDYADPAGATTTLALVRLPTTGRGADRLGSLVVNPGGPGASGIEYARTAEVSLSDAVRAHFDVVGFDPRGVGSSAPLQCLDASDTDDFLAEDPTPDTPAEVRTRQRLARELGEGCADAGALAAHVDSGSVARDLDVLRAALGDDRLSYLGKSYGTFLGALYAQRFPGRVGRVVLDGAIDPALTGAEIDEGQAQGFEQALGAYVENCQAGDDCPLTGTVEQGREQIRGLLRSLDADPLPTGDGARELTEGLATLGLAYPLYAEQLWPQLTEALTAAFGGDGTPLLAFADAYAHRTTGGEYSDNSATVIYAVNCLDRPSDGSVAEVQAEVERLTALAPTFGPFLGWGSLPCVDWPIPSVDVAGPVSAAGAGPILVVGTTRDPATPYAWAQSLAAELESGRLLTYDGDGHTAYRRGSACIDADVDDYLLTGVLPAEGTTC
ncbi:alpha/beta hydrolase [Kineococcus gynurae]|uniref:Alpha/beta hydrolase n=1 Tax=Kineococcus gynurae TaxID=452979 RepID=A0ABV5LU04_9ACTN